MRLSTAGAAPRVMASPRLNRALLVSLLAHALLLSLSLGGGEGFGLPGLDFPWQARRAEVPESPDLRVVLEPVPAAAPPSPAAPPEAMAEPLAGTAPPEAQDSDAASFKMLLPADAAAEVAPPVSERAVLAVERPAAWAMPAASALPMSVVAAMSAASGPSVELLRPSSEFLRARGDSPSRERTAELAQLEVRPAAAVGALSAASSPVVESLRRSGDALRPRPERELRERSAELAQLDSARQEIRPTAAIAALSGASSPAVESLRRASEALRPREVGDRAAELAQLDNSRQEAQQRAQQLEANRLAAERQEAARAEAARQEAARQQAAQAEAARLDAERREAARLAAARQEAARLEAARQDAARADAARLAAAKAEEEQREARKRAIGRQLDEEAARRDAERQRPDWTPARRGRLFGRTDSNAELVLYAEAWMRKIQINQTFDMVREAAMQPHTDPIVTVAVRSNGSVESITFVRSSGVPAIDQAIERVVRSQENYPAFAPALLRDYDVVEIRRTWHFDSAIRLN